VLSYGSGYRHPDRNASRYHYTKTPNSSASTGPPIFVRRFAYWMRHVFISYVREDTQQVNRLCADLASYGAEVWLDRDSIQPGTRWREAIRCAIQDGDYFVACF